LAAPKVIIDQNLRTIIQMGRHRLRRREPSDWTQEQTAKKAGISTIWYAQLESGVRETTKLDTLLDIFEVLKIPPRVLRKAGHPELAGPLEMRLDWFAGDALGD
jgi:transcriptional regulator with XRE-family HTH domain